MPVTTPPVDTKSRQSSGGRSFFGRKLHRDKSSDNRESEEGNLVPAVLSHGGSASGSRSSKHSHRASVVSVDISNSADLSGLSMTAGAITSIPYDSVSADSKTPISVDYLPRSDQVAVRREPLPHHLNKGGGDFHQYPAWDPTSPPTNGSSHLTGPRPPPHSANTTAAPNSSSDRVAKSQQWGRAGSAANPSHNPPYGNYNSYSTADSSTNPRTSFDQASVYSSVSSATRGSSLFSSDNSSRTAIPSQIIDHPTHLPIVPHPTSRQSNQSNVGWQPQQPSAFNSTASFTPEGFHLERPEDDNIVEAQFLALMHKRGWQNLPEQAKRQMLAYPATKKWTLVHQDKLTEWQGEQKRRLHARQTVASADGHSGLFGRADEEGSPEWFVRKVMDDTITPKQLQSLSVSLRTQPIR